MKAERGAVSLLVATFAVFSIAAVLVLFDGGRRLQATTTAQDLASETARFAAAILDQDSFPDPVIDADLATTEAEAFAISAGASEVTVEVADDGRSVIATVTVDAGTSFTPGFDLSAQAQHRALALNADSP